jgi:FHA domain
MSLMRLIVWSGLIGGWSAFFGWLVLEVAIGRWIRQYDILAILMATMVAIPIGGGISLAYGLSNPKMEILLKRLLLGFAGGLVGGLIGVLFGSCIFAVFAKIAEWIGFGEFVGRTLGWALIGIGIGVGIGASEGVVDRSFKKLRNGVIGGLLGGFLGGLAFFPISRLAGDMSSRAVSFVLLGLTIGLFIGLAQVILKEAWITVEAGFRPGRQMILGKDLITMGTSEKSSLIFIAFGAKGVEPTHLKIIKQEDGRYRLEDNQSRTGTLLNGQPIAGPTALNDGDAIQFGVNVVRFNERAKRDGAALPPAVVKEMPKAVAVGATQAVAPTPVAVSAIPVAKQAPVAPPTPVKAAPKPAPAPAKEQEGRCPICDKKIAGVPGERRCRKCFTTF